MDKPVIKSKPKTEKPIEERLVEHEIAEESMDNSWKDEFIVLVFSLPVIVNFILPIFTEMTMKEAWENLNSAAEWYTQILFILVLVIFGMRKLVYKLADKLFDTGAASKGKCCK